MVFAVAATTVVADYDVADYAGDDATVASLNEQHAAETATTRTTST